MNAVLEKILATNLVDDPGGEPTPLHSHMSEEEGALIDRVFREVRPELSLEIGFAYGVSTLFACDALAANGKDATHIVLDPYQHESWNGIGLRNIARAGYARFVDFREEQSEIALPTLYAKGTRIQAAIIDGNHTFDQVLVDFFYVNKMLDIGGVAILDDTNFPSISRVVAHIMTYPAYEVFDTIPRVTVTTRTRVRRALAAWLPAFRRSWDRSSCVAFRKIAEDQRRWDWHADF